MALVFDYNVTNDRDDNIDPGEDLRGVEVALVDDRNDFVPDLCQYGA